jgi:hypothetical protein
MSLYRTVSRNFERGAALVTSLIFLIVISLFTVTSIRSSTLGVRMAQNEEARFVAIQAAQALTEIVVGAPGATPVTGTHGFSICTLNWDEGACNLPGGLDPVLPAGYVADEVAADNLRGRVVRFAPTEKPPPRMIESSLDKFTTATFEITAKFDRSAEGLGAARLVEGVLVLVPVN